MARFVGNFHVSRFVRSGGDEDRPFTVYFSRLDVVGERFFEGRTDLVPSRRVVEVNPRYRKATRAEAKAQADELNRVDLEGGDPEAFQAALAG